MYLTDYTLDQLRVIQAATDRNLEELQAQITESKRWIPDSVHADVTAKDSKAMSILKEHNANLLMAIQTVKDRQDAEIADPERFIQNV